VVWCGEGGKHRCVSKIVEWYSSQHNVSILDEDVQLSIASNLGEGYYSITTSSCATNIEKWEV
jgi:hypothetical protein